MECVVEILKEIFEILFLIGYIREVMEYIEKKFIEVGIKIYYINKGVLIVGNYFEFEFVIVVYVDILGVMVKGIFFDGYLSFMRIGGFFFFVFEGEYCMIIICLGKCYCGMFFFKNLSVYVNKEVGKKERIEENMYICFDVEVEKKEDIEKFGIRFGDFIVFDLKFEYVNGFVKVYFLDDKVSVVVLIDFMFDFS